MGKASDTIPQNKSSMFSILLGQCSKAMKSKLESKGIYDKISESSKLIGLLELIRNVAFSYKSKQYPYLAVYSAIKRIYGNFQRSYTTNNNYMETFQILSQVVTHCGGNFGHHPELVKYVLKQKGLTKTSAQTQEIEEAAAEFREAYMAMAFLSGLNNDKYQGLLDELTNAFLSGRDEYPKTVVDAYNLVTNWRGKKPASQLKINDGVNFNIFGEEVEDGEFMWWQPLSGKVSAQY